MAKQTKDIYNLPIPTKIKVIRGDKARMLFSNDGQGMNLGVQQYTFRYTQRQEIRNDLSDPDTKTLIRGFPDTGTGSFVCTGLTKTALLNFVSKFGDICDVAGNNITVKFKTPVSTGTTSGTCNTTSSSLVLHGVWISSLNISVALDNPLINVAFTISFIGLEIPS